jgi:hypothetical protein
METSLVTGVCVVIVGVLWRSALDASAPAWLGAFATAVIVIGVVSTTVTLGIYAVVLPIGMPALATLFVVAGVLGMIMTWA